MGSIFNRITLKYVKSIDIKVKELESYKTLLETLPMGVAIFNEEMKLIF